MMTSESEGNQLNRGVPEAESSHEIGTLVDDLRGK